VAGRAVQVSVRPSTPAAASVQSAGTSGGLDACEAGAKPTDSKPAAAAAKTTRGTIRICHSFIGPRRLTITFDEHRWQWTHHCARVTTA
jgi:hypothetical protein